MDFLKDIAKQAGNEYASIVADGGDLLDVEIPAAEDSIIIGNVGSGREISLAFEPESVYIFEVTGTNNAGIEEVRPSFDVDEKLWDKIIDTNLKGAFFSSQSFDQQLKSNNKSGSIINLGSLSSSIGIPTATAYTSSKSGILGMTKALSAEWANYNIRVNSIAPGYFRTSLTEVFYSDENWQKTMLDKIPMKRFGKMEDLHGITILLASDASSYITGQIFYIDGGFISSI